MCWVEDYILRLFVTSTGYVPAFCCRPKGRALKCLFESLETPSSGSLAENEILVFSRLQDNHFGIKTGGRFQRDQHQISGRS